MKKEICIDVRMAFSSGIGTYIRNVVQGLQDGPYRLRLLAHKSMLHKWPALKSFDLIFTEAPVYSIREQLILPLVIPSCDIFFSPHYAIPCLPIRARKRVVAIHDVYHLAFARELAVHKRWYAKGMLGQAVRLADKIVTISRFSESEIVRYLGINSCNISVVHLGVDRHLFSEEGDPIRQQAIRDKYNLPKNYFIFVSTLAPHKNVERLLKAWALVTQKFPEWQLVCVGRRVKKTVPIQEKGVMVLDSVGVEELPFLYQLAYAAIHPSLYEGFGLTPLEAMSCGCPAIVSRAASLPEVYGESVCYVDPYDVRSIAAGMEGLIQDPGLYAELKVKGVVRSEELTWKKTVEAHIEVFDCVSV